ncbi:DUF3325 domain-containing protein [Janthinobacterium fluminis]|uniref:DUF3325 domain-containing protein n=1 Tax=Janthinobacterium fluminis TaxID=2987524 RepID=A0ABT5K3E6_9BURK|nr:DUF3325 domain-containing protein [Janthinobacterium fluminis]MDC8758980.1 DUF3325 domain-containing protein [Janthinobacterium fluminis]
MMLLLDNVGVFALNYAGLAGLCLAMERHSADLRGRGNEAPPAARRKLRLGGWAALALALCWAGGADDGARGLLFWLGSLTACGLLLIVLLPYAARHAARLAVAAAAAALLAGALSLG